MAAAAIFLSAVWTAGAEVPVVDDAKGVAVVVIPERANGVARYAAKELVEHIAKASGGSLEIVPESRAAGSKGARIYLGDCEATRAAGIDVGSLAAEAFVLRTSPGAVFIAGADGNGEALDPDTRAGTLWGAYEWLERALGVRWLWPGELGTYVPTQLTIVSPELNEQVAPHLMQRKIRPGLGWTSEHPALGFTQAAAKKYADEQSIYLRRHRMGRSLHLSYGHAFTEWWKTDGKAHPEWFQLLESGKRGPSKPTSRFSMCVSNPDLQREIVERWKRKSKPDGRTPSFINAVENDFLGMCSCDQCRAWDGPGPGDYLKFYSPKSKMAGSRFVSDRYAHFWLNVQQLASAVDPNATVIGYVYFNYFQAPTSGVKLNEHVVLGFCPSGGFFPRSEEEQAWMKQQWQGWRDTGARLFLRTNHLLDGYAMPYIFVHQFADEFQHAARNGLVATDFDSLTGQWACQGPTLYVAARLHVQPQADIEALLGEYYSAFGPAAEKVKAYFDYWERYTTQSRGKISETMETLEASRWRSWAKAAHALYAPAAFGPAEKMLDDAAKLAAGDEAARARVEFLRLGLQHAQLCAAAAAECSLANQAANPQSAKLMELMRFRRAHEESGIANFNHCAWVEDASWKLGEEARKAAEVYP